MYIYHSTPETNHTFLDANHATALTLHRRLTAFLHTSSQSSTLSAIREAAEHFSLTFFPWAQPEMSELDKDQDLVNAMEKALETRIWLWGQGADWGFEWEGTGRRGVLIAPSVVRGGERVREGIVGGS